MSQYWCIPTRMVASVWVGQARKCTSFLCNKMNEYFRAVMYLLCLLIIGSSKMRGLLECECG